MVVYYYYAHAVPLQLYNIIRPTAVRWVVGTAGGRRVAAAAACERETEIQWADGRVAVSSSGGSVARSAYIYRRWAGGWQR